MTDDELIASVLDVVDISDPECEFDLAGACAVLSNLEHEPCEQASSDTLWVELRLACAEVRHLTDAVRAMREMVDLTNPDCPIGTALTKAGLAVRP